MCGLSPLVVSEWNNGMWGFICTLPAKIMDFFPFQQFFCIFMMHEGCYLVWNTFLRADITFWGANSQLTARLIVRCLPYPIVCCIELLYTIPLFIYCLMWCDQQGINVVGASRRKKLGVGLACHKVISTKISLQTTDLFIENRRSSQSKISPSQDRTGNRSGLANQQILHYHCDKVELDTCHYTTLWHPKG